MLAAGAALFVVGGVWTVLSDTSNEAKPETPPTLPDRAHAVAAPRVVTGGHPDLRRDARAAGRADDGSITAVGAAVSPATGRPLSPRETAAPTDDLSDLRARFARSWASLMASPRMPDDRRRRLILALAHETFGQRAEVELARVEQSEDARREVAHRAETLHWLRREFASLQTTETMAPADRRAAVRRLLDEYLDRLGHGHAVADATMGVP